MSDDGPDPDAWIVTFGDLITLLLTFFILTLAMSSMDSKKLQESFSYFSDRPHILEGGTGPSSGPNTEADAPRADPAQVMREAISVADAIQSAMGLQSSGTLKPEEKILDAKGEVRIKADQNGQVITFSGSFLFRPGRSEIEVKAMPVLDNIIRVLKKTKSSISIQGHTDNHEFPFGSRWGDRWDLSTARALKVLKYLIQKGKISGKRLSAAGYADTRPIVSEDKEGSRARNRRIELVILADTNQDGK